MVIRVLVVDDEEGMLRSYQRILTTLSYEICGTARSYEEAVRTACETRPDVIIMDVSLGRSSSDGIDAAREINSLIDVPVIFVSAFGNTADTGRIVEPWSYGFIKKPFDLVEIQSSIELAVNKYRTLRYEQELLKRDGILKAVNSAAALFLSKEPFEESLKKTIELIGKAVDSVHICLYRNTGGRDNIEGAEPGYEWKAPGYSGPAGSPPGKLIYDDSSSGFKCALYSGEIVRINEKNPPGIRGLLQPGEGSSLINIPLFCGSYWWGFLSLQVENKKSRDMAVETEALVTAANILGSALNQKRMNDVLLKREEEYRNLYKMMRLMCDNVPDAIWVKGNDRRYRFVNRTFAEEIIGAEDTDEPIGKTIDFFSERERASHPGDPDWYDVDKDVYETDSEVLATGKEKVVESGLYICGKKKHLDIFRAPFYDEEGNLTGIVGCARDETKRKDVENNLRELNERFQAFMNALPGHAFVKTHAGVITYVNSNRSLTDGIYTPDWTGKKETEAFSGLDPGSIADSDLRAMESGSGNTIERAVLPGGDERIYSILRFPVISKDGEEQIGGIVFDITEKIMAEESLRRSEELSSILVNQMPVIVWTTDTNLDISYAVGDPLRELGFPSGPGSAISFKDIIREVAANMEISSDEAVRYYSKVLEGESFDLECMYRGRELYIYVQPFRDKKGEITGTAGLAYDITDKKVAEKALIESEERYRQLVENIKVKIMIAQDCRVVYANQCLLDFLGLQAGETDDFSFESFICPGDLGTVLDCQKKGLSCSDGPPEYYKIGCLSGTGDTRMHDLTTTPIMWDGRPATLVFLIDIEDEARAKEELERSLHEKILLLGEVHHRVKNNLALINSLLMMQIRNISHPGVREGLLMARTRIFSIASVHEGLYRSDSISSIPAKKHFEKIGAEILENYDPEKRLGLEITGDEVELDLGIATPVSLVVNELLINAIKYAYPGEMRGKISINLIREEGSLELRLKDEGVGIPGDFSLDDARSLGLSLVKNIVNSQLEGSITLNAGEGTEWIIRIPLQE